MDGEENFAVSEIFAATYPLPRGRMRPRAGRTLQNQSPLNPPRLDENGHDEHKLSQPARRIFFQNLSRRQSWLKTPISNSRSARFRSARL